MTDAERDALLLEIRDTQRDHGARLERIEVDHGGKLDRLLTSTQGQAAARVKSDERLAVLERRVADPESKAG